MRLRHAVTAVAGTLLLVLPTATPASAASGKFEYRTASGEHRVLDHPASRHCLEIPGATRSDPAHSPENDTRSTVTLFLDSHCDGETFRSLEPGKKLGPRLHFRSVIFS
ncbi:MULTISPECIES: hypothetical protein [unclassified Streptomyces]|uniref:hypothetical protein n=1 Tax=unclassified Streptomyces TaxID=2593676 RepID=UPI0037F85B5A